VTTLLSALVRTLIVLTIAIALIGLATPASAVLITNDGGTVFFDNFESSTVGLTPGPAVIGTWNHESQTGLATNAAVPGAFQGTQYLYIHRPGNNGVDAVPGIAATSGTVHIEEMVNVDSTQDPMWGTQPLSGRGRLAGGSTLDFAFFPFTGGDGQVWNYGLYGGTLQWFPTGLSYQTDTWQKWQVDFTFVGGVASTYDLTVGSQATVTGLPMLMAIDRFDLIRIWSGDNNATFYVDATRSVPEPTTIALLGSGLLGMLGQLWRRRRQSIVGAEMADSRMNSAGV
jgi:PEP-CTERM motif